MPAQNSIEVAGVSKTFRIPAPDQSLVSRFRAGNPFAAAPGRDLEVLRDINFEIRRGEFFGVVGRNGSGKSTLLKLIAGIYGADQGRIRVAGRLAPFLELGVGFSPELPAHENVIMNAVMMGLTRREARRRADEVIEFAGLEDYTDLKLNNYSSGMRVRLGFAVLTHVDADVLLVDEVLAVGDAEFREKCEDVFDQMHDEGRTIVLVTHSMDAIIAHCQRALMLHDGVLDLLGAPDDVANRYAEVNVTAAVSRNPDQSSELAKRLADVLSDPPIELQGASVVDERGEPAETLAAGAPIELRARVRLLRDLPFPMLSFKLIDSRQQLLFQGSGEPIAELAKAGTEYELSVRADNHLAGGRYMLACWIDEGGENGESRPASGTQVARFSVEGEARSGVLSLDYASQAIASTGNGEVRG